MPSVILIWLRLALFLPCLTSTHMYAFDKQCLDHNHTPKIQGWQRPKCLDPWMLKGLWHVDDELRKAIDFDVYFQVNSSTNNVFCRTNYSSIPMKNAGTAMYFPRFPHFAEKLFYLISTVMWQNEVFHLDNDTVCMYTLSISDESPFWTTDETDANVPWLRSILTTVEELWGIKIIQPTSCLNQIDWQSQPGGIDPLQHCELWPILKFPPTWFLHPGDAYLFGSMVLKQDACLLHNTSKLLLAESLNILVVSRRTTRGMANDEAVMQHVSNMTLLDKPVYIHHAASSQPLNDAEKIFPDKSSDKNVVSITFFEDLSFIEQAQAMRATDVLITIHGAAETNMVFMKPCSVVIEIFPWGYNKREYFESLAEYTGMLHYSWQEHFKKSVFTENTARDPEGEHKEVQDCMSLYQQVIYETGYNVDEYNDAQHIQTNDLCERLPGCTLCSKAAKITISLTKLEETLAKAVQDRARCIEQHPFYNPPDSGYFYPFSQEVNLKEGSLIRNKNSREINLLEGGYKRPFQSGHGFLARGFDFGDVIAVEGTLLDKIPDGEPIP